MTSLARRQRRVGWMFIAPALAVVAAVGLFPLFTTVYNSFTDARLGSVRAPELVGLKNYARLFGDREFLEAATHTVAFTAASVSLEFIFGLMIALVIHQQTRARGIVRAAILVPWALPTVVSAKMWSFMLVDTYGVVNDILYTKLGLLDEKIAWLARPGLAFAAIVCVDVWKTTPFVVLLLLAGLQFIPRELYEAAEVDGARRYQRLLHITLPMLKPAILVTLIFRTLDALRVFDVIWVMTRGQLETESMATYNYRQLIDFRNHGYGSAVSVAIFAIIAVFVIAYLRVFRVQSAQEAH